MNTPRAVRRTRELQGFLLVTLLVLAGCTAPGTSDKPEILFFFVEGCDHCSRMMEALQPLLDEYSGLAVRYVDFGTSSGKSLLQRLAPQYGLQPPLDPPVILVCNRAITGEGRPQELALRSAIVACASTSSCSPPLQ
jgi:thiol-disulfide isomerase/thioredoxin